MAISITKGNDVKVIIAAIFLALIPGGLFADSYMITNPCRKPYRPFSFENKYDIDNYQSDIDNYKRCIEDFVEQQNTEAVRHKEAAGEAIDEWNRFVKYDLNN